MKRVGISCVLSALTILVLTGCATKPSSSSSEFSYEPFSGSGAQGYVFDMDEKYSLKTNLIDVLNEKIEESISDIEVFTALEDVIGVNDFYANKVTITTSESNLYGLENKNSIYNTDNYIENTQTIITRDNTNHTLAGESSKTSKTSDGETTTKGTYSLTYDEGLFCAIETWDYDNQEDISNNYLLSDEFVEKHLALTYGKELYEYFLDQYEDTQLFGDSDIVISREESYINISLNRNKVYHEEEILYTHTISLTISKDGYISDFVNNYIVYNGTTTHSDTLYTDCETYHFEKI